jgi:hypothetical protein
MPSMWVLEPPLRRTLWMYMEPEILPEPLLLFRGKLPATQSMPSIPARRALTSVCSRKARAPQSTGVAGTGGYFGVEGDTNSTAAGAAGVVGQANGEDEENGRLDSGGNASRALFKARPALSGLWSDAAPRWPQGLAAYVIDECGSAS